VCSTLRDTPNSKTSKRRSNGEPPCSLLCSTHSLISASTDRYTQAAQKGNPDAQCNLGWMYASGQGGSTFFLLASLKLTQHSCFFASFSIRASIPIKQAPRSTLFKRSSGTRKLWSKATRSLSAILGTATMTVSAWTGIFKWHSSGSLSISSSRNSGASSSVIGSRQPSLMRVWLFGGVPTTQGMRAQRTKATLSASTSSGGPISTVGFACSSCSSSGSLLNVG